MQGNGLGREEERQEGNWGGENTKMGMNTAVKERVGMNKQKMGREKMERRERNETNIWTLEVAEIDLQMPMILLVETSHRLQVYCSQKVSVMSVKLDKQEAKLSLG